MTFKRRNISRAEAFERLERMRRIHWDARTRMGDTPEMIDSFCRSHTALRMAADAFAPRWWERLIRRACDLAERRLVSTISRLRGKASA